VPGLNSRIEFLKSLLPHLEGIKWIYHRKRIENEISDLNKQIKNEQLIDIME